MSNTFSFQHPTTTVTYASTSSSGLDVVMTLSKLEDIKCRRLLQPGVKVLLSSVVLSFKVRGGMQHRIKQVSQSFGIENTVLSLGGSPYFLGHKDVIPILEI